MRKTDRDMVELRQAVSELASQSEGARRVLTGNMCRLDNRVTTVDNEALRTRQLALEKGAKERTESLACLAQANKELIQVKEELKRTKRDCSMLREALKELEVSISVQPKPSIKKATLVDFDRRLEQLENNKSAKTESYDETALPQKKRARKEPPGRLLF